MRKVGLIAFQVFVESIHTVEALFDVNILFFEVEWLFVRDVSYSFSKGHGVVVPVLFDQEWSTSSLPGTIRSALLLSLNGHHSSIRSIVLVAFIPFLQVSNFARKWLRSVIN